jgi:TP901 family phage tail tape measure protein
MATGGNNLKILITGTLNSSTTVTEINRVLSTIESKINKIKINVQIDPNAQRQLNNLATQVRNIGGANTSRSVQSTSNQISNIGTSAHRASQQALSLGDAFKQAFTKFPIWIITGEIFMGAINSVKQLVSTLYLLDERLISIDKVLENANMAVVFENATKAAYEFGRTIDGALESLGEISKLGFNQQDAEALNRNSMLLSTVGEFKNDADAANYLVAIMRQYKFTVEETTDVVSALNEVSNKTGATTTGLAEGLSKSSSMAAMAGVNFNDLNGMMASTIETLKIGGREAGNFYKTLFTRMLRGKTQSTIVEAGVQVKDLSGELRSATDVLQDLGANWSSYSSEQKNALAQALGGVYHINKVSSLLEHQADVYKNAQFSANSYNSAQKELATFQEGLAFKTNNMKASFQELFMTIGESGGRDTLVKLIEMTTSITQGFTELTESTDGWNIKLPLLAAGIYGTVKAISVLRVAMTGLKASFGVFGVALVGVELLASVFMKSSRAANLNTQSLQDNAQKSVESTKSLEMLISQYDKLKPQVEGNAEKQQELQTVLEDIQKIAPHLIESTGKYGDALDLNKTKADQYIESLKEMTTEQIKQAQTANSIELSNVNVDIDKTSNDLKKMEDDVKESFEKVESYQKKFKVEGINDAETDYAKRLKELTKQQIDAQKNGNNELIASTQIALDQAFLEYSEYVSLMKDSGGELADYSKKVGDLQELESKKTGIEDRKNAIDGLTDSLNKNVNATQSQADALSQVAGGNYEVEEGTEGIADSSADASGEVDRLATGMFGLAGASEDATNAFEGNISALEIFFGVTSDQVQQLQNAINVYRALAGQASLTAYQQGLLTQSTAILSSAFPYLNGKIDENIDWMATQAQVMGALGEISGDEASTLINNQNESTRVTIAGINSRIQGYTEEAAAITALMDTLIAEMELRGQSGFRLDSYNRAKARLAELQSLIAEANTELGNIIYQDAVDLGIIKPDGSTTGGSENNDAEREAEEARRNQEQFLKDVVDLYKDAYGKQQDIALDALEKEKQAFESAHEAKMKQLDDQLELYEDIIQAQIESIDKQEEEEAYAKRLKDAQKSRQEILDEINKLQLDNSFAARKRIDELQVQLAESNSSITDMQHEKEVQDRKDNLQSMLDKRRTEIEGQKETEQNTYDTGIISFENRQAEVERYYENLINDERYFAQVRAEVLSGSNDKVLQDLHAFHMSIADNTALLGESISQNMIDVIQQLWGKILGGNFTPISSFDTGGFTGSFGSKGKLAMLHEKEIVLNKTDTSNFLKAIDLTRNFFKGVTMPKLPNLQPSLSGSGGSITLNFNVAKMSGDKSDVNFFMNEIVKGVNSMGGKL